MKKAFQGGEKLNNSVQKLPLNKSCIDNILKFLYHLFMKFSNMVHLYPTAAPREENYFFKRAFFWGTMKFVYLHKHYIYCIYFPDNMLKTAWSSGVFVWTHLDLFV